MAYNDYNKNKSGGFNNQGQQRSGGDNRGYNRPQATIPPITLDYTKDVELFNTTAQSVAEKIAQNRRPETKSTQMRNFYDYVLELYDQSKEKDFSEVLPFIKMLNSKVAYAKSRSHVNDEFVLMIQECIKQVDSPKKLEIFKLFFEALIGFSKK
jgi:CRISPR-associated protein Csm2